MLVLSRKPGDSIVVDGGIRITVVDVRGQRIRLGIEAPRGVSILRGELEQSPEPGATERHACDPLAAC